MGEGSASGSRAVVEEIIRALGDDVLPESQAWWQYALVTKELGDDIARQLVGDVHAVEAAGGMVTKDGTRRRTPGGVFFALAYQKIGDKRSKSVRGRAHRRGDQAMVRKFLKLLRSFAPPGASLSASTETARGASTARPGPSPSAALAEPTASSAEPAASTSTVIAKPAPPARGATGDRAAKPAPRREPEVEVLVVRRRAPSA
jgi:hypothetical protein